MGEILEMILEGILEGILCEICGSYIDYGDNEPPGYPVKCDDCQEED